jgi:hypothetical protein
MSVVSMLMTTTQKTRSTTMDLDVSFENPSDEVLKKRINTWLTAIGVNLEVVVKS